MGEGGDSALGWARQLEADTSIEPLWEVLFQLAAHPVPQVTVYHDDKLYFVSLLQACTYDGGTPGRLACFPTLEQANASQPPRSQQTPSASGLTLF